MKRLIVFIVLILVGLMAGPAGAQNRDLAGTWTLDVEKTGSKDGPPSVVLTLTASEFTARLGGPVARLMTFKTDGTETDVSQGVRGKAVWTGNTLEATLLLPSGPETVKFSRDGAWLLVEPRVDKGPARFFFKRDAKGPAPR
jgi:hypothetical protein